MIISDLKNCLYLGDGVYIGYIYGVIYLITYDGIKITNEICLEDQTLTAMNEYLQIQGKNEE